jgi:WD40 repeat protein
MLTPDEVARDLDLLREYRRQLSSLILRAQQYSGEDDSSIEEAAPAGIVAKIRDVQEQIRRIKATLDSIGIEYAENPLDTWFLHEVPRLSVKAPPLIKSDRQITNVSSKKEISGNSALPSEDATLKTKRQNNNVFLADTQSSTSPMVDNEPVERRVVTEGQKTRNSYDTTNNRSETSADIENASNQDNDHQEHKYFIRIIILIGIISYVASLTTNIATETIPDEWKPYLWISWPILFLCVYLSIRLEVQEYQYRNKINDNSDKNKIRWWQIIRMIRQLWSGGHKQRFALISGSLALISAFGLGIVQGLRPCHWIDSQAGLSGCYARLYGPTNKITKLYFEAYPSSQMELARYYAPIAASQDGKVYGWGETLKNGSSFNFSLPHPKAVIDFVPARPGFVITWSEDQKVRLWDIYNQKMIYSEQLPIRSTLAAQSGQDSAVSFLQDDPLLATNTHSAEVELWNVSTHEKIRTIAVESGQVPIAFSSYGQLLAVGLPDNKVSVIKVEDGTKVYTLTAEDDTDNQDVHQLVNFVVFQSRGSMTDRLATVANDKIVRIWNGTDGSLINDIPTGTQRVDAITISPDGSLLALATSEGTVEIWRVDDNFLLAELSIKQVSSMAFSPSNKYLTTGLQDGELYIWIIN